MPPFSAMMQARYPTGMIDKTRSPITAAVVTGMKAMTVDRSFLFAIRDEPSGLYLFMGMVNNPLLTGN